jgi:hypothetical protein
MLETCEHYSWNDNNCQKRNHNGNARIQGVGLSLIKNTRNVEKKVNTTHAMMTTIREKTIMVMQYNLGCWVDL